MKPNLESLYEKILGLNVEESMPVGKTLCFLRMPHPEKDFPIYIVAMKSFKRDEEVYEIYGASDRLEVALLEAITEVSLAIQQSLLKDTIKQLTFQELMAMDWESDYSIGDPSPIFTKSWDSIFKDGKTFQGALSIGIDALEGASYLIN